MAEENALISLAKSGDEQAFADLMRAHYAFVYRIVVEIVNNPHDAEEVVQDTFLNVYRGLTEYEERTKFRSWLAKIARNRALNWRREQRADSVPIDDVGESTVQAVDSLDERLIRDEQRELIRRAMGALSQKDRDIARAYYLDGASYDELIRTHGLSYKAISFRLSRAKRTLEKRLQYLLTGAFVPPATTLKNISSGGLTAMKIGTVPKITIGAIAIIVIAFIGSHQLLSSKEGRSSSVKTTASTTNKPEQSTAEIDAPLGHVVAAPSHLDEPQISAEEMGQIEDFFAQLEADDAESDTGQLAEAEFRQDADESVAGNTDVFTENTEQSAEEVMNAFLEAFRIYDRGAMRSLLTADMRERSDFPAPMRVSVETTEVRVEERDGTEGVEHSDRVEEKEAENRQLEQLMLESVLKTISQAEVVDSEYVDDEFHFKLGVPALETPGEFPGIDSKITLPPYIPTYIPIPDLLIKMRKEADAWRIYDNETLD